MKPFARLIVAAAALEPQRARVLLAFVCKASATDPREAKLDAAIERFHQAINRVLHYAQYETLRNLERHFRKSAIKSAAEDETASSARIAFSLDEFARDLLAALAQEQQDTVQNAGQQMYKELGRNDPWRMPAQATIDFINARANRLKDVPDEIWQTIQRQIAEGLDKGEAIRDIANRITSAFDEIDAGRAQVIASTEAHAAYGFSRNEALKSAGIKFKQWIISGLPNVRHAHQLADGQVVPINQPFLVGGENLQYPGDPGGSPENTINCRCIIGAVLESELGQ